MKDDTEVFDDEEKKFDMSDVAILCGCGTILNGLYLVDVAYLIIFLGCLLLFIGRKMS